MIGGRLLGAAGRRLRSRLAPRPVVLAYHRIAAVDNDPFSLCVTPADFAGHLEMLSAEGPLVALSTLLRDLQAGKRIGRATAITFDDGYLDNLTTALPLLERFDAPATFFLTGAVVTGQAYWWDQLERAVFAPPTLPAALTLATSRGSIHWASAVASGAARAEFLTRAHTILRALDAKERDETLSAVVEWSRVPAGAAATPALISADQLSVLGKHALVSLGAHTMTHPLLAGLSIDRQSREIGESRRVLRELTGQPVDCFAYPFGGPDSYGAATRRVVAEAGFRYACTTDPAAIRGRLDPLRIPRLLVPAGAPVSLARRLRSL